MKQVDRQLEQLSHNIVERTISQNSSDETRPEATGKVGHEVQAAQGEDGIAGRFHCQESQARRLFQGVQTYWFLIDLEANTERIQIT